MANHILKGIEGFIGRGGEIFKFDPRMIKVVDGWNSRRDFSMVEFWKPSIKDIGVQEPLIVRKSTQGEIELVDGETRLRAVLELIAEGVDIKAVPVIVEGSKVKEDVLLARSVLANGGTPLKPSEEAGAFRRLINYGWSEQQIADTFGKSISTVKNRLELINGSGEVREAVDKREISIKAAREIIAESDGKVQVQGEKLEKVKAVPRKRRKGALKVLFEGGTPAYKGPKDQLCPPLFDLLIDNGLREKVEEYGFDFESVVISVREEE